MQNYDIETLAVRAGIARSQFNEHSEALYLTSSFVFENAAEAADRFCNNAPGNIYSRFTNPTVTAFQERLAALEGAQACVATASGMSAILATAMATLKAGDHVVCSSGVFGATVQLFSTVLSKFGIETTYADGTQPSVWKAAIRPNTRLLAPVPPPRRARALPGTRVPSAARPRDAPAALGRRHRLVRRERRARGGVARDRFHAHDLDHGEPGRHQDHHHASRHYHSRED